MGPALRWLSNSIPDMKRKARKDDIFPRNDLNGGTFSQNTKEPELILKNNNELYMWDMDLLKIIEK